MTSGMDQHKPLAYTQRPRAPTITVDPGASLQTSQNSLQARRDDRDTLSTSFFEPLPPSPSYLDSPARRGSNHSTSSVALAGQPDTSPSIFLDIPRTVSVAGSLDDPRSPSFYDGSSTTTFAPVSAQRSRTSSRVTLVGHESDQNTSGAGPGKGMSSQIEENPFAFSPKVLAEMTSSRSIAELQALGGLIEVSKGLRTGLTTGLSLGETWPHGPMSDGSPSQAATSRSQESCQLFEARKAVFGTNRLPDRKIRGIFQLMLLALGDKVLILLSAVATISLLLGLYQSLGQPHAPDQPRVEWVDGVTIMAAVLIVVVAGALNDYQRERQFARLNARKEDRMVKAIRSGKPLEVSIYDVLVGDVLKLEPGDVVPADGILISGYTVRADESSLTGESEQVKKVAGEDALARMETGHIADDLDPFIISGSKILEGTGTYLVTGVGVNSTDGRLRMALIERTDPTPLQQKLSAVADKIATAGVAVAVLLFLALMIKLLTQLPGSHTSPFDTVQRILRIFIVSIAIVVVAVPEGLPLAVTLALAIAVTRMLKHNNLVRVLASCETMGNATTVCCDKTGTLTINKMRVTAGIVGATSRFRDQGDRNTDTTPLRSSECAAGQSTTTLAQTSSHFPPRDGTVSTGRLISSLATDVRKIFVESIAINSTAFEGEGDGKPAYIGSQTEAALLAFAKEWLGMRPLHVERANAEVVEFYPFNSGRKCMACVVRLSKDSYRLYVKGAPEILLEKSTRIIPNASVLGEEVDLTRERCNVLTGAIDEYASQSLRTLGFAYRVFPVWPPSGVGNVDGEANETAFDSIFADLTFLGVVGMQDPLRPGVEEAVAHCQRAGVYVRMVTGDNVRTAQAIAGECGILTESGIVMEGPQFRKLSTAEMDKILPRLQVLARSSPEDKMTLVKRLKELGETVAVTGDGTNDGPALRAADIGFSMGICGTEVAKEASSIVLMDDNFSSIVKAIEWGRTVNDVIKKFLHFQLTVNITAVTLTFVSAIASDSGEAVLTPVQLLWVNLIMDTFAALALATDPANPAVLERQPERKTAPLIGLTGWKMIIGQAIYQLAIILTLHFAGADILAFTGPLDAETLRTLVFNSYVWMQFFNLSNNRRLDNKLNVFEGLHRNPFFIGVNIIIIIGQVLIIFFGGSALSVTRLNAAQWAVSLLLGFLTLPAGIIVRLIPDDFVRELFTIGVDTKSSAEFPVSQVSAGGSQWQRALQNVRCELAEIRQPRSSRLSRLRQEILAAIKRRIVGLGDEEGEADETDPLLPSNYGRGQSRSGSICAPAAAMTGFVAGSVGGWPRATAEDTQTQGSCS